MATGFDIQAKNIMLQALKDWNPSSAGTAFNFVVYSADADEAQRGSGVGTYGTPTSGSMNITSNVVINVSAGSDVTHIRIQKGSYPNNYTIYKKDITAISFPFAGSITITSAQISLVDA